MWITYIVFLDNEVLTRVVVRFGMYFEGRANRFCLLVGYLSVRERMELKGCQDIAPESNTRNRIIIY